MLFGASNLCPPPFIPRNSHASFRLSWGVQKVVSIPESSSDRPAGVQPPEGKGVPPTDPPPVPEAVAGADKGGEARATKRWDSTCSYF